MGKTLATPKANVLNLTTRIESFAKAKKKPPNLNIVLTAKAPGTCRAKKTMANMGCNVGMVDYTVSFMKGLPHSLPPHSQYQN